MWIFRVLPLRKILPYEIQCDRMSLNERNWKISTIRLISFWDSFFVATQRWQFVNVTILHTQTSFSLPFFLLFPLVLVVTKTKTFRTFNLMDDPLLKTKLKVSPPMKMFSIWQSRPTSSCIHIERESAIMKLS